MSERHGATAIVIGAGMAGLMAARVLSDHVDHVTILERDRLPEDAVTRRGVPQGRHVHTLLAAGQRLMDGWFPGVVDDLTARGAIPVEAKDVVWHQGGGYRIRSDLGFLSVSMSRPLLEGTIRQRLLRDRSNVSVAEEMAVDRLVVERGRVVGVRVDEAEHRADLVVACSGRNTRFADQLADAGFPVPEVSAVRIDMVCGTRVVRRRPDDLDGTVAVVAGGPVWGRRVGTMVPIEGDRWMITIGSFHGDVPPTEPAEYEDFAHCLPSHVIADVLARAGDSAPVFTHRMLTSQRRHMERLEQTPRGFLVLGDAICSFNPIYALGMSSAALQARALGQAIESRGPTAGTLARDFYRRAAKVVDGPWKLATGADFADPRTTGPKPIGTDLVNRYLRKVFQAGHRSAPVARQTMRVHNLLARQESLMTPAMVVRVLLAGRRVTRPGRS